MHPRPQARRATGVDHQPVGGDQQHFEKDEEVEGAEELETDTQENNEVSESIEPFEVMPNGQLRFALELFDDYSVTDLEMSMTLDDVVEEEKRIALIESAIIEKLQMLGFVRRKSVSIL